tara:strand:+ start:4524 stop:5051 length:528 start_codon:yes stop_codon:yes gene_type:complete
MPISTKTGDKGETSLGDGRRVSKSSCNIDASGAIDELNSTLGLIHSKTYSEKLKSEINTIQNELFVVGMDISTLSEQLKQKHLERIEKKVEEYEKFLGKLTGFVLPTGTEVASLLHIARTLTRRAERKIICLTKESNLNSFLLKYMNRLSDLFYLMALSENKKGGQSEQNVNFDI